MITESNIQGFKPFQQFKPFKLFVVVFKRFQRFKPFKPWNAFQISSFSVIFILPWLMACGAAPKIVLDYGSGQFTESDLKKVLLANPLALNEDFRLTTLGQSADASQHIVQIRNREIPHTHNTHDSTVFMLQGHGYLVMDGRRIDLREGDIIHIPRGVPHYYVNTAADPTVAFVVFAPPFDGKDNVPVAAR